MVRSIYVYDYERLTSTSKLNNTIEFEYEKDESLRSIKSNESKLLYSNGLFVATVPIIQNETPKVEITADNNKHIISVKEITTLADGSGIGYGLKEFQYGYDKRTHSYSLVADSSSTWFQKNGGAPIMAEYNEYKCNHYEYHDGNPQKAMFVRSNGRIQGGLTYHIISYGAYVNDTNVNLSFLGWANDFRNLTSILSLTEWCPIPSMGLPIQEERKDGVVLSQYEYEYSEGNLVSITKYAYIPISRTKYLSRVYKIEYVQK